MHETRPMLHWQVLFTHVSPGLQVTIPQVTPPELDDIDPLLVVIDPLLVVIDPLLVVIDPLDDIVPPVPLDDIVVPLDGIVLPVEVAPPLPVVETLVLPPQLSATPPSRMVKQRALRRAMASSSCEKPRARR
jgi:hypothetical protein